MRKILIAVTFSMLAASTTMMPLGAHAQNALGGAIVGAGAGAVIGGAVTGRPEGAAVGAVIGGTTGAAVGANADERDYRNRTCWRDDFGRRHCRYR
jgi:outer membrane lipoprotein SlyB